MPDSNSRITIIQGEQTFKISFSRLLGRVHQLCPQILSSINSCISFYSDPEKKYSGPWNPFWIDPHDDEARVYLEHFNDPILENLVLMIPDKRKKLYELVLQMTHFLANYWGYDEIKTREDSFKIGRKRSRIKKWDPLPWVEEPEFKLILNQFYELRAEISPICEQLVNHLVQTYNYSYIKDFGDQKAKDLIDRAYNAKPKTALKYLNKAISFGRPTFMSYSAYSDMGDTFRYLKDFPAAIEAYSNGIEDFNAIAVNKNNSLMIRYLFCARGLCYWETKEFESAYRDLETATRGITDPKQFGPHQDMYLKAVEKLAQRRD